MCKWCKSGNTRIDPCMRQKIRELLNQGIQVVSCCCGHGLYPQTIVAKKQICGADCFYEVNSKRYIHRIRRFYKRDTKGIFFIPEVIG